MSRRIYVFKGTNRKYKNKAQQLFKLTKNAKNP